MISVENLCCRLGRRILFDRLSFSLEAGQTLFLVGPNGAGKSTLLRLLSGLLPLFSGRVCWEGDEIAELGGLYRQQYLWLTQNSSMRPELTVQENLNYLYSMHGQPPPPPESGIWRTLGLESLRARPAGMLSDGERARAALPLLLDVPRKLWLLDEPTASLDDTVSADVEQMMAAHADRGGVTVCATHRIPDRLSAQTRFLHLSVEEPTSGDNGR